MKILVVSDHGPSRHAMRQFLSRDHDILTARTQPRTCQVLQRSFDLQMVIIDSSDAIDASTLCHQARDRSNAKYPYILVLVEASQRESMACVLRQGADAFMVKPVDVAELEAHIQVAQRITDLEESLGCRVAELIVAQRRLTDSQLEQKRFCQDVLRVVTNGKLHLVEETDIPIGGRQALDMRVQVATQLRHVRAGLRQIVEAAGMDEDRVDGLLVAAGEALTNALLHAAEPHCEVWLDGLRVLVRIRDRGQGMALATLPEYILRPGSSSKVSMGAGFEIVLRLVDEVWLSTGPDGTTIQLAQRLLAPPPEAVSSSQVFLSRLDQMSSHRSCHDMAQSFEKPY